MFKIINYFIILILFPVCLNLFAQTQKDSLFTETSTVNSDTSFYKLKLNPFLNSHKLFLGQKNYNINLGGLSFERESLKQEAQSRSLSELKLQMNDYLSKRRNLLPNYDLGDFGKYLGYTNALAAILLAISHISKYGFK